MGAVATQMLADETDFRLLGSLASAVAPLDSTTKQANLRAASGIVLAHYKKRCTLPLVQWGDFTKILVVWIAAHLMLTGPRGLNPSSPDGKILTTNYDRAIELLRGISDIENKNAVEDPDLVDSSSGVDEMGPLGASEGGALNASDNWTQPTDDIRTGVPWYMQ